MSPPAITIRSSTEDDIDGIKSVLEASAVSEFALVTALGFDPTPEEISLDIVALEILTELSDPDFFLSLVAVKDEQVVGYVRCWLRSRLTGVGSVSHVGVLPEHQGQGIAGKLIRYLVEVSTQNKNFKRLELEVAEDNLPAVSVYRKAGFSNQPTKVLRKTLVGECPHLLMYLDLNQ